MTNEELIRKLKTIEKIGVATYGGVYFEPTGMYRDALTVILNDLLTAKDTAHQKELEEAVGEFASNLRVLIERGNAETAMNIIKHHSEPNHNNQ